MRGGGCSFPSSAPNARAKQGFSVEEPCVTCFMYRCLNPQPSCYQRLDMDGTGNIGVPFAPDSCLRRAVFCDFLAVASQYVMYSAGLGLSRVQAGLFAGLDRAELVHASYERRLLLLRAARPLRSVGLPLLQRHGSLYDRAHCRLLSYLVEVPFWSSFFERGDLVDDFCFELILFRSNFNALDSTCHDIR